MGNQNVSFFFRFFPDIIEKIIDSLCQTKCRFSSLMAAGEEFFRLFKVLSIPRRGFPFSEFCSISLGSTRHGIPVISEINCAVSFARLSGEHRISSAWIPSARIFLPVSLACSRPYSVSGCRCSRRSYFPHSTRSVRDGQSKSVPFIIPPSFFRNTSSILLSTSRTAFASLPSQNALLETVQDSPHSPVLHRRTAHW